MPWIAMQSGDKVWPEEVDDGKSVVCPECESEMFPRGPTSDGRARHFAHKSSGGGSGGSGCSGVGEGDRHKRWKSFAASKLKQIISDEVYGRIRLERPVPLFDTDEVSETVKQSRSSKSEREADVYVEFEENHLKFGRGIAVEVQDKNKGKDIEATEADYLSQGVSVLWLREENFGDDRCTISRDFLLNKTTSVFPTTVPKESNWQEVALDIPPVFAGYRQLLPNHWLLRRQIRDSYDIEISEPSIEKRVQMPIMWYQDLAHRYYRNTPWGQLFKKRRHNSYLNEFRKPKNPDSGEGGKTGISPKFSLDKWLDQDNSAFVRPSKHYDARVENIDKWHIVNQNHIRIREVNRTARASCDRNNDAFDFNLGLNELVAPNSYDLPEFMLTNQDGKDETNTGGTSDKTVISGSARETRRKRERNKSTNKHRQRYEGWRNDDGETAERFDKSNYRWVTLDLADVPDSVIEQRRSG